MAFGQLLRDARERKGYDLNTAARRLRIRPDILHAIETNDFANMPPRGYTRNMVNAYARLVDLNPTEITLMYLEENHSYQNGRPIPSSTRGGRDSYAGRDTSSSRSSRSSRDSRRREDSSRTRSSSRESSSRSRDGSSGRGEASRTSRTARFDEGRSSRSSRSSSSDRSSSTYRSQRSSRRDLEGREEAPRYVTRSNMEYTNFYTSSLPSNGPQSNAPFFVAGILLMIILILVLVLVFSCSSSNGDEDETVTTVPITGMTDTTTSDTDDDSSDSDSTDSTSSTVTVDVPTSVEFVYEVLDGETAYIEVYLDDGNASVASSIEGPTTNTFTVTGTLKFVTTNPDGVVITLDGEEVEAVDLYGKGVYTYTIDFEDYLEEWAEENDVDLSSVTTTSDDEDEDESDSDSDSE